MQVIATTRTALALGAIALLAAAGAASPVAGADLGHGSLKDTIVEPYRSESKQFSVEMGLGYLSGDAEEIVYANDGRRLSHLDWRLDDVVMLNTKLAFRPIDWVTLRASSAFAISGESTMDDYDWLVPGQEWTHWSHHEHTDVKHAHQIELSGEVNVIKYRGLELGMLAGYKWDRYNWDSRGGSYIYSSDTGFRDLTGAFPAGELGISYTQDLSVPFLGLAAGFTWDRLSVHTSVVGSNRVKASGKDTHHLRDLLFEDNFHHGRYVAVEAEIAYAVTDNLSIVGTYDYQEFSKVEGTALVYDQTTAQVSTGYGPSASGLSLDTQMYSLALRYAFH